MRANWETLFIYFSKNIYKIFIFGKIREIIFLTYKICVSMVGINLEKIVAGDSESIENQSNVDQEVSKRYSVWFILVLNNVLFFFILQFSLIQSIWFDLIYRFSYA